MNSDIDYEPIRIEPLRSNRSAQHRAAGWERLFARCPGMKFYLRPILSIYECCDSPTQIGERVAKWEASAPRQVQRIEVLGYPSEGPEAMVIEFGRQTATGKTTTAFERIWRDCVTPDGIVCDPNVALPVAMTGHAFARRVAGNAKDLDRLMDDLIEPDWLLLDDLDKRGDSSGQFSPLVQQTFFDLIEARTTENQFTILTLNSNGDELLAKFDDDIGIYLLRRLRERFRSVDFDPVLTAENVVPLRHEA